MHKNWNVNKFQMRLDLAMRLLPADSYFMIVPISFLHCQFPDQLKALIMLNELFEWPFTENICPVSVQAE